MVPEDTKLEAETRKEIDAKLAAAGWVIQDKKRLNLYESLGGAVREMDAFINIESPDGDDQNGEVPLGCTDTGPADYMLFVNGKACGILEAKREGTDLGGVAEQSARYATSQTKHIERWSPEDQPLPFLYEATNHEIRFRDERDPHPRSRFVFHFHKPETLKEWLEEGRSLRDRLPDLPELITVGLRARSKPSSPNRATSSKPAPPSKSATASPNKNTSKCSTRKKNGSPTNWSATRTCKAGSGST